MPKYLFTSDQRVSILLDRIKYVATHIQSGQSLSALTDKSDNNNATTLRYYYNLFEGTETCAQAVNNPTFAVRNFVLKFQFPNPRTPESLADSINEKVFIAPFRSVVSILYLMADQNQSHTSELSLDEILYFVFGNPKVFCNPSIDYKSIIEDIAESRNSHTNLQILIPDCVEWKQYDRQNRELMNVLCYSSPCFKLSKGIMHFSMDIPEYENDKTFIESILSYNKFWYPTNKNDFNQATLEYISYMNTADTPYSVVEFNVGGHSSSSQPLSTLNPATLTSFNQQLLSAVKTKPFVLLAGISGTGKSRIVRELAKACWPDDEEQRNAQEPKNFMMIQVRPNWHDSTELIGYVSRINGEKYIAGDFIKFVARAWQDPGRPYFLCLDEMNLAPVEQYFAEYLSIIESRKLKNGKIVTDAIMRPDYKSVDGEKIVKEYYDNLIKELIVECPDDTKHALYVQFKTDGISIPQNLIVIGTVNMDETTYSFSRKVLDRAMTLEMNEVDMWGGLVDDESFNFGNLEDILANAVSDEKVAYQQDKDLCDKVLEYLENVNSKLEGTPFKIAYRTRNEFLMYALNRKSLAKDDEDVYIRTIDEMTSMKILSRIEGDFEKTSRVLSDIKDILKNQSLAIDNSISLKKIDEMEKKLKSGYTSYWA